MQAAYYEQIVKHVASSHSEPLAYLRTLQILSQITRQAPPHARICRGNPVGTCYGVKSNIGFDTPFWEVIQSNYIYCLN